MKRRKCWIGGRGARYSHPEPLWLALMEWARSLNLKADKDMLFEEQKKLREEKERADKGDG